MRYPLNFKNTDEALVFMGQTLWAITYGQHMNDLEAFTECAREARDGTAEMSAHEADVSTSVWTQQYSFAVKWADSGYPKLMTGHKYAAALMATKIDEEFAGDMHLPGKAFLVALPRGILEVAFEDGLRRVDYDRISVATYDMGGRTMASMFLLDAGTQGGIMQVAVGATLEDVLFGDVDNAGELYPERAAIADAEKKKRVLVLARRLVVGLLLAMNDTANFKDRSYPAKRRGDGREEPAHRIVFFGKPVSVDCRPAIAAFIGGKRKSAPSFQTMVRGHHKRQVVGIGRTGRRIIWIEPYWRGPEDAPILARPHMVGGKP